jgi:hypothetical protein
MKSITGDYTIQVKLQGKASNSASSFVVNNSTINASVGDFLGTEKDWGKDQNYTNIIIKEL